MKCFRIGSAFINKFGWHSSHGQTEEVLELSGEDADGNTKCKADRDRLRDKFDQIAEMAQSHDDHDDTGQKSSDCKSGHAILGDDAVDDNNECCGRTADLHAAATEQGDEESCDDGCVQTLLRIDTGGNGKCNRQRQCDDRHDDTCDDILHKLFLCICFHSAKKFRFYIFELFHVSKILFTLSKM